MRPAAHESAGISIANAIGPLDTLGQPDPVRGRVVFVSIGMSNCTQEFSAFVSKANADPVRKPNVRTIDCALWGVVAALTVSTHYFGAFTVAAQAVWLVVALRRDWRRLRRN